MAIKVRDAIGSRSKTVARIDLTTGLKIPSKIKTRIKRDVGDFLVETITSRVGEAKSPVKGEDWPKLDKEYAEEKREEGVPARANMELTGDMLDSLEYRPSDQGIEIGFFGDQAWKADGHLKFSGKENNTPKRRFLPDEGQEFISSIQTEIEEIIADAVAEEVELQRSDLEDVDSKTGLYDILEQAFPGLSRPAIKSAVSGKPDLIRLLETMNLLRFL